MNKFFESMLTEAPGKPKTSPQEKKKIERGIMHIYPKVKKVKFTDPFNPKKKVSVETALKRTKSGKKHPGYGVACSVLGQELLKADPSLKYSLDNYAWFAKKPEEAYKDTRQFVKAYNRRVASGKKRAADDDGEAHPTKGLGDRDKETRKDVDRGIYGDMYKQIKNSETGNMVNVKTVLGYGSDHPDYEKAFAALDQPAGMFNKTIGGKPVKFQGPDNKSDDDGEDDDSQHDYDNGEYDDDEYDGDDDYDDGRFDRYESAKVKSHINPEDDSPAHPDSPKGGNYGNTDITENSLTPLITETLKMMLERDYKKEYEKYHSKPEQIKRRAARNKSRRKMEKLGHVKKGSSMDVHHKNHNPSDDSAKNLAVIPKSKNRSMNQKKK